MVLSFALNHLPPSVPSLLARVIRPAPLLPLELALGSLVRRICEHHPRLFERLGPHQGKRFGIKPTDLPFAFVVRATAPIPQLAVVRELPADLDAQISASLVHLLALAEGRLDGDALMFSRQLVVEGDLEAVLSLRNAIDDARLDFVAEIAKLFGPLATPVERGLDAVRNAALAAARVPDGAQEWN